MKLEPFINAAQYPICEYNFNTMLMWSTKEKYFYHISDNFAVVISKGEMPHALMPICEPQYWLDGTNFLSEYFSSINSPLVIAFASSDFCDFIINEYSGKATIEETRDYFDYLHLASELITLRGRKFDKKRNHINRFKKYFADRYEYRSLTEDHFEECRELMKDWNNEKQNSSPDELDNSSFCSEYFGVNNLLSNHKQLGLKIGGIYIDQKLEAFTVGSYLLPDTAQIHVEKANANIRGIYQFLNQEFLRIEFPDVVYVNREDDAGIEGMRIAKLSYHPIELIKKHYITIA